MAGCLGTGTIWRLGAEPRSPLQEPCLRRIGTGTGVSGSLTFGLVIIWHVQPQSLPFPGQGGGRGSVLLLQERSPHRAEALA